MLGSETTTVRAFFEYGEQEQELLAALRPLLEKRGDELVQAFYRHLLSFPETRKHLRDPEVTERLLGVQREYLQSLAGPEVDEAYVAQRRRIGEVHERAGIEPRWYLGAYALYVSLLTPLVLEHVAGDPERAGRTCVALTRLLFFDAQVAMERYIDRREQDLEHLNQELAKSSRVLARDLEAKGVALRRTTERARAAERLASIGTLVAGLAHEIGTPMGVIQGHAKLLEPAVRDENAKWRLRTIQEQVGRISRIIQSLLNMARPGRTARVPVPLAPLLENTLAFLTEKFANRRIEVAPQLEESALVHGDPERLQQLFLNLFINAADAMPEGGRLGVTVRETGNGEAEIRVSDTGTGIGGPEVDEIFDPFFTTKAAGEGHGLGLSVAHGIVADHHGLIEVAHTGEEGTEFRILLPSSGARRR